MGDFSGGGGDSKSATTTSYKKIGDRVRFEVELRPNDTTIVSWKKLMKDVSKAEAGSSANTSSAPVAATAATKADVKAVATTTPPEPPPPNAHPALESRLAPVPGQGQGQADANEQNDAPAPNRFSAVIEKIERLYMGKDSSDDEDLNNVPDDDQYDTEDSFIDDAELDEYFEVDKSKTKHDGYFVNRGTLEKVEPSESAIQQPKKRRRKEMSKDPGGDDSVHDANKHKKVRRKRAEKPMDKNGVPALQGPSEHTNASGAYHQKIDGEVKPSSDLSASLRTSNGDAPLSLAASSDRQTSGGLPAKNPSTEALHGRHPVSVEHKAQSVKHSNVDQSQAVKQQKDKSGMRERIDLNLPDGKHPVQPVKTSLLHKKEGSSVRPKANVLDKAIRELEKVVAESRPPAPDALDADSSAQSIKRRLPREIKQKLAKVARIANASNSKVSAEVLNRLMGILGHLIQIRTLKRHLKVMGTVSLSAKQEKDDKFQQMKKDVMEMIKTRVPALVSKAAEQQSGGPSELQEAAQSDKVLKGKVCMDATLEDKICDVYDVFVEGLDDDSAPQVRKLYAELAELWPKGVMDNHGIKRAICRAKERRRTQNEGNKNHGKIRRKKVVTVKTENTVRVGPSAAAQPQLTDVRLATDLNIAAVPQQNKVTSSVPSPGAVSIFGTTNVAHSVATASANVPNLERSKQDKVKGTHNSYVADVRTVNGVIVKKKVKRKAENLLGEFHPRSEKSSHNSEDRQQQPKNTTATLQNSVHKASYDEFRFEPLT